MPIRNNSPKIFYLGKERQNRGGKRYSGLVWEVQAKTTPPSPLPSESVLPAGPRQPWLLLTDVCCCSVAQLCLTLCDSMDCSMPGFRVLHHFLEFAQNSCPLSWWCHPTISSSVTPFFSCPQSFPASVFSSESALHIRWPNIRELQLQHQTFQRIFRVKKATSLPFSVSFPTFYTPHLIGNIS